MRIGIDARELRNPNTGVGTYLINLIEALAELDYDYQYVLFIHAENSFGVPRLPSNFSYYTIKNSGLGKITDQISLAKAIKRANVDVYHVTHHDAVPLLTRIPLVVTVHDIVWLDLPSNSSLFNMYFKYITSWGLTKAQQIISVSKSTKQRIISKYPKLESKITAIAISCNPAYYTSSSTYKIFQNLKEEFNLKMPYVLYVGSFAKRKNLRLLLAAMEIVRAHFPKTLLVIAGKESGVNDTKITEIITNDNNIIISRSKSIEELKALYQHAEMLAFPSLYEGFGLPILEAMASGCPVVASNATSIPEITGDVAMLSDPSNVEALAENMISILKDPKLASRMRSNGRTMAKHFNWTTVAERTILSYHQAII
jgi:glycosyltransferase involved in cell wall biosynthesis